MSASTPITVTSYREWLCEAIAECEAVEDLARLEVYRDALKRWDADAVAAGPTSVIAAGVLSSIAPVLFPLVLVLPLIAFVPSASDRAAGPETSPPCRCVEHEASR